MYGRASCWNFLIARFGAAAHVARLRKRAVTIAENEVVIDKHLCKSGVPSRTCTPTLALNTYCIWASIFETASSRASSGHVRESRSNADFARQAQPLSQAGKVGRGRAALKAALTVSVPSSWSLVRCQPIAIPQSRRRPGQCRPLFYMRIRSFRLVSRKSNSLASSKESCH